MSLMKKFMLVLFIIVTFASNAAVSMASGLQPHQRGDVIGAVMGLVCLSMASAYISLLKKG